MYVLKHSGDNVVCVISFPANSTNAEYFLTVLYVLFIYAILVTLHSSVE